MAVLVACAGVALTGFFLIRIFSIKKNRFIPRLDEKHVFITGASSGIGLAIAKQALLEGAFVTISARNSTKLNLAMDELVKGTNCGMEKVRIQVADVSDREAITSAIQDSFQWKPIDVLICNAGLTRGGYFDEVPIEDAEITVKTNLLGTVYPIHAILPLMKKRSHEHPSSIAIVGSIASLFVLYGNATYTATKYALKGLAECLRLELLPYNINVNLICPGFVKTALLDDAENNGELRYLLNKLNLYDRERADTPESVACCTLAAVKHGEFLVSPASISPMLLTLSRGFLPSSSFSRTFLEAVFFFPLRLWSFMAAADIRKVILKAHHRKPATKA